MMTQKSNRNGKDFQETTEEETENSKETTTKETENNGEEITTGETEKKPTEKVMEKSKEAGKKSTRKISCL